MAYRPLMENWGRPGTNLEGTVCMDKQLLVLDSAANEAEWRPPRRFVIIA